MKKPIKKLSADKRKLIIFASAFVTIGLLVTLATRALPPFSSLEPENANLTTGAIVGEDGGASGGEYVQFGGGGFQANCINVPSTCGYPDETNTGVPAGTQLTNSGSISVTQNGTVIENRNISGQVFIRANNVTIRNSRITSGDFYPIDYEGTGLL